MKKYTNTILASCVMVMLFFTITTGCEKENEITVPEISTFSASISTATNSVTEADAGFGFKVSLDKVNDTGADITISYNLAGTATSGADYTALTGSVIISNGQTDKIVDVSLIDDSEVESDETISITLSATGLPTNVTLATSQSITITITDNDTDGCANDNSINQNNWVCDISPSVTNVYTTSVANDIRTIVTNGYPNHDYRIQIPEIVSILKSTEVTYTIDATPTLAANASSLTNAGSPIWQFGVATNGVSIDPAPAQPFIFTNTSTGEYNWDWVMEPNNNMEAVGLDCAIAHVQPDGEYHYHGNMAIYADILLDGLGSGTTVPAEPYLIGWAADGFPILYEFGPNASGTLTKLAPSYQLIAGERVGDGVSEPCGEINGKYTNDYEFVTGLGDLDECNGIAQSVTIGAETFSYFYVITDSFPYISRCLSGTPDNSFAIGGGPGGG